MGYNWIYELGKTRRLYQSKVEAFLIGLEHYHRSSSERSRKGIIEPERFSLAALEAQFPDEAAHLLGAAPGITRVGAAGTGVSDESRLHFDHLIRYHIRKFVGRSDEVKAILDFIDSSDRGYLFVDGLSGFGKTSLLATLVRQHPTFLLHFISQAYKPSAEGTFDPTRPEDLMSNVCRQLDPHREIPSGRRALTARFQEAVRTDRDDPTTLVLDAIDEVNQHPSFLRGLLPQRLPRNLFILLSARRQGSRSYLAEVGLELRDIGLSVTLDGLGVDAIHELLLRHAGPAGAALSERDDFVDSLRDVSGGDPFYLRFLVEDVEQGLLNSTNIQQAPSGLGDYLDKQFEYLDRAGGTDLHVLVLGRILAAYGPLHRSDLLDSTEGLTGGTLDRALRDVQRFLLRTGPHEYTFCHNRFKEHFRQLI